LFGSELRCSITIPFASLPFISTSPFAGITATQGGITANGDVEMNGNEAKGMVIEQRNSDPNNPSVGRIWYRADI
jgi:hypothetical protein